MASFFAILFLGQCIRLFPKGHFCLIRRHNNEEKVSGKTIIAFVLFVILFAETVSASYTADTYDEDGLNLIGATTLTTGMKQYNITETADHYPGNCAVSFYCWLERRANGTSGSWTTNSTDYLAQSNTYLEMYFYNVTGDSSTRLRASRYNFQSGRILGSIYFY